MTKRIMLVVALLALASVARAGQTISPAPPLRQARPDEIPSQVSVERGKLVRAFFPGAVAIPPLCKFSLIDATQPETHTNIRLKCSAMTWADLRSK